MPPPPPDLPPTPPPPPAPLHNRPLPPTPGDLDGGSTSDSDSDTESDVSVDLGGGGEKKVAEEGGLAHEPTGTTGPGLSLAQLRQAMRNLPSKQKSAHYDFVYADSDNFENEFNEFYNYQDNPYIQEGRALFELSFQDEWKTSPSPTKTAYISLLLESLEQKDSEIRYSAAKKLLYISQGCFAEHPTTPTHITQIHENNHLLFQLGALSYFVQSLRHVSATLDLISRSGEGAASSSAGGGAFKWTVAERQAAMDLANVETSIYLSLIFGMVECCGGVEEFVDEVADSQPCLVAYLFTLVAQLAEGNRKHYPVKKLLLLLWKLLLTILGDTEKLQKLKNANRKLENLPPIDENALYTKIHPQDYHAHHVLLTHRYPTYVTPPLPPTLSTLPPSISSALTNETHLPPSVKRQMNQIGSVQPFVDEDDFVPVSLKESVEVFGRNVYVSLGSVQVGRERRVMERGGGSEGEGRKGGVRDEGFMDVDEDGVGEGKGVEEAEMKGLRRIEELYRHLLPHMPTHVGMLVRLLYYVNLGNQTNPSPTSGEPAATDGAAPSTPAQATTQSPDTGVPVDLSKLSFQERQDLMDKQDLQRHKEVVTKAVSGILVWLVKGVKCQHVLKAEYISQLLVDNNCAILILKMLSMWFQNPNAAQGAAGQKGGGDWTETPSPASGAAPAAKGGDGPGGGGMGSGWLRKREECRELNFFTFCRKPVEGSEGEAGDGDDAKGEVQDAEDTETTPTDTEPSDAGGNAEKKEECDVVMSDVENGDAEASGDISDASTMEIDPPPTETKTSPTRPVPPRPITPAPAPAPTTTSDPPTTTPTLLPSSYRTFFTSISLLRLLQKLTKRKPHRLLALVQWKASAVLKRILKVPSVAIQLYALKILKGQVPFLGRKWRGSNMKVVTGIYMHLRPVLKEEWLSGEVGGGEGGDADEALAQEQTLRALITFYHQRTYPDLFQPSFSPSSDHPTKMPTKEPLPGHAPLPNEHEQDELEAILKMSRRASFGMRREPSSGGNGGVTSESGDASGGGAGEDGLGKMRGLTRSSSYHEKIGLDTNFMENYEEWLFREVFEGGGGGSGGNANGEQGDGETGDGGNTWPRPGNWDDWGGTGIGGSPTSPRRLFSATEKVDVEEIGLGEAYNDQEWGWEEDEDSTDGIR
ncbi:Factor arrest protein 11, partial [Rhizophlyctis rosea]